MLKDHSPLTPDSPPQQKGPNEKPLYVNNRELPIFQAPCPSLGAAFPCCLGSLFFHEGKNSQHQSATQDTYLNLGFRQTMDLSLSFSFSIVRDLTQGLVHR
jgi:hypothetical protein